MNVEPPMIPLIQINNNEKWIDILLRLNCVGIQCQKSRTYRNSKYPCLIMAKTEEFLLFGCNSNMTLEAPETLKAGAKIQ